MSFSTRPRHLGRRLQLEQLEDRRVMATTAQLVRDINTSTSFNLGSSDPSGFTNLGIQVLFSAATLGEGRELWKSNGLPGGTTLVKDINPFGTSSNPEKLARVGNQIYFLADDGTPGVELWKTDGTTLGTVLVKDLPDTSLPQPLTELTAVGNKLFFFRGGPFVSESRELWVSDGTAEGTVKLKDFDSLVPPNPATSAVAFNGQFYFAASSGSTGMELWRSDGTPEGTEIAADIGPNGGFGFSSSPHDLEVVGNTLFFAATLSAQGTELWKTDGTSEGAEQVADIAPDSGSASPSHLTNVAGTLYFITNVGGTNYQLYTSNGTPGGTQQIKDFGTPTLFGPPGELTAVGTKLFFESYDSAAGSSELWVSDGTADGTDLVKDIVPGLSSSNPEQLTPVGGRLFFRVQNDALWMSDGTEEGTQLVQDSTPSFFSSQPRDMAIANGVLYLGLTDTEHARELWRADVSAQPSVTVPATATYTENALPVLLAPLGTISDSDSLDLAGGRLLVQVTRNASTLDRIAIRNQGSAAGQVGVSSAQVTFEGVTIGTCSGGVGTAPLLVVFNSNATPAAAQAVLRSLTFRSITDNPSPLPRQLRYTLADGDGAFSTPRVQRVNVLVSNDAPRLTLPASISYTLNSTPSVRLAPTAVVIDPDSLNFGGGRLHVAVQSGEDAGNRLFVGGPFTIVGLEVRLNDVVIGLRSGNGAGTNDLQIELNANATRQIVQQLVRAIRFRTINSTSTADRVVGFTLTDGNGGTSDTAQMLVTVT